MAASKKASKKATPRPRDWAYLQSIREGRVQRAATFVDRRKEASRRGARGKLQRRDDLG